MLLHAGVIMCAAMPVGPRRDGGRVFMLDMLCLHCAHAAACRRNNVCGDASGAKARREQRQQRGPETTQQKKDRGLVNVGGQWKMPAKSHLIKSASWPLEKHRRDGLRRPVGGSFSLVCMESDFAA